MTVLEEADQVAHEARHEEQDDPQPRVSRPSRRKSLLSRARSLSRVKSLSDLRRGERSKDQHECMHLGKQNQTREGLQCAVVRRESVSGAPCAPLYFF
jgi:hypothetical protein